MIVHNIYKVPANVPAKSPGKMTAQFKSMTLNSSSKGIPIRYWVVMYYSVSNNPHVAFVLCLNTGIYHKDSLLYPFGSVGICGHAFWIVQCSQHFPKADE